MRLQWKRNNMPLFVAFLCLICSIVGVKISPEDSELVIGKNDLLALTCSGEGPVRWSSYPGMDERKQSNKKLENGTNFSKLSIMPTKYSDTGYYTCQSENNASDVAQIYVYCFDDIFPIVSNIWVVNATMYDKAIIPCRPTSPNISLVLTKMEMGFMDEESIEKYDPKIGFVISTYPIIKTMYFTCAALKYKFNRRITVKVHPPLNDSTEPHIEVTDSEFRYPILENQNATMNCSVITSSNLGIKSIEWHFPKHIEKKTSLENISVIQHQNFNTFFKILNVYNVTETDEGNYTCTVTDDNSNVKHYTHSLHVIRTDSVFSNLTIPQESRELTVQAGGGNTSVAQFIATAKCFPKCQFTWFRYKQQNRTQIGNTNSIYSLSKYSKYQISEDGDEIKLKINHLKLDDFGIYQIEIENNFNRSTGNFSLIVEAKPEINLKIYRMKLFKLNTTVHHECNATGYPVPQIAWSAKNCNNYPTCEDEIFKPIPASMYETTTGTYEVMSKFNFTPNQSMIIQCVANNSLGNSNESSTFLLTDHFESGYGVFMIKNYSEPINVGDNVKITCVASKYYFKNFSWAYVKNYTIKNSHMDTINPSEEIHIENSASNFSYITTLLIPNIQKNHSGRYSCGIDQIDLIRKKFNFTELTVHEVTLPSIVQSTMNNEDRQVTPGKTVKIIIKVDGYPSPSVLWYKDDKPLQFNDRINLTKIHGIENLSIANVSREDEGVYKFIASNKAGNVSDWLKLSIKEDGNSNYILWISIFLSCFLVGVVFCYIRKLNKDKNKLKKMLREFGLEQCKDNAVFNPDPDLDIEEQTLLIPYNKKYEFPKERLQFGKTLGSGAFGIVKKAEALGIIEKDVRTTVAVKVAKRHQDFLFVKALASELKIMIYLGQHLNVVNLLGACTKDLIKGELAVIVEYCRYGNIHDFLLKRRTNFVNQITKNDEIDFTITSKNSTEEISQYETTGIPSRSYIQEEETPIGADGYLINNDTICKSAGTTFQDESIFNDETTIGSDGYFVKNELYEPEWRSNYLADVEDFTTTSTIKTIDLICWSYQVARGMEYLASRKVLHGDLAARNILLTEDNIVKICDFGLAKSMYQDDEYQSSKTMFPVRWMALESIRDRVFSTQSDVWSFGITMWEFFSLSVLPYPGMEHLTKLYEKLESGYRLEKPAFATNKIYNIMRSCWEYHPKSRPSFTQLREQLGCLLEDSIRSQYIDLDEINKNDTKEMKNAEVYLKMLSSPVYCNVKSEPAHHYVNVPLEPNSNPGYVEMKNVSPANIVHNQGYINI